VSGQDLNGRPVNLPSDFLGPASLVFIPFEMKQQGDVDSWDAFGDQGHGCPRLDDHTVHRMSRCSEAGAAEIARALNAVR
jgi:hypothetical protein